MMGIRDRLFWEEKARELDVSYMGKMKYEKPDCYTRGMLKGCQTLPIAVTVSAKPRIKRSGPPTVGQLFFDAEDRLIYVTDNPSIRVFTWHRVFTDGRLSTKAYTGLWDWGEGAKLTTARTATKR